MTFTRETRGCGIMLRTSPDLETGYYIRLEPSRGRLVFDSWPRPGAKTHWDGLERPLTLEADQPHRLVALVDRSVCEVYVDDRIALAARIYDHARGSWGVFVSEGEATFRDVALAEAENT